MALKLQDIAAAAANSATFQRGLEYYGQNRVSRLHSETDTEHAETKITADVRGGKYSYEVEITLDDNDGIVEGWCDCPAFYEYQGCCKHIVATLIGYSKQHKDQEEPELTDPGRQTDSIARDLIERFNREQLGQAVAQASNVKVRLEPLIEFDYRGRATVFFSAGRERLYVVKDLGKFTADMRQGATAEYGTRLKFAHFEQAFDEASKPILAFLMKKYAEQEELGYSGGAVPQKARRGLRISAGAFDELFGLLLGREIPIRTGFIRETRVLFCDSDPELGVTVREAGEHHFLIGFAKPPAYLYFSDRAEYILAGGCFHRCSAAYSAATRGLFTALNDKGEDLLVHEDDMAALCGGVLGGIREHVAIQDEGGILPKFEPAPLSPRLYLDMPVPGTVTARLVYAYGTTEIDALDEEAKVPLQRDARGEYLVRAVVEQYIANYDLTHRLLYVDQEERVFALLSEGLAEISAFAEVYTTDSLRRVSIRKPPAVRVGVRMRGDLIDLDLDTADLAPDEFVSLLASYRQHKRYHRLKDGSFINLEESAFADVSDLAQGLDMTAEDLKRGSVTVHKYRAMYIDTVVSGSMLLQSDRDAAFRTLLREMKDIEDADVQPPEELLPVLRNYQKKGFQWLKTMSRFGFGGILADDMGLGKTLEAIAYLLSNKDEAAEHEVSLVVCPTSLVLNWESEIRRFAPRLRPLAVIGNAQQREGLLQDIASYDVIITSYELLKRDRELYERFEFDCEILDEAQSIKNAGTINAKAVKSIRSRHRFALTGTPVENSLAELWSVFDFLMPGYLYSHAKFRETFEVPIVKQQDAQAQARLRQMVAPFILRRLKSSVLRELPPKTETVLYAGLEGEQRQLYQANLASIRSEVAGRYSGAGIQGGRIAVLSMLTRLRQLCCDPSLCYEDYHGESAKLDMCLELIASSVGSGHKVLVFSQFTSMLSILEERLKEMDIRYYLLKGSTSKEERARLISSFNTDQTKVFLISLKAGGTGLNLTAADIVIHYDPWWNVSAQNQATDRVHRIGQKNSVQVYKLIAKDTVEEKILQLQESKLRLADAVISEAEGGFVGLTEEDLKMLFAG